MATKLENLELETAHAMNFIRFLPGVEKRCSETISWMLEQGFSQVSTMFEHAIANRSGLTVTSRNGADFDDDSDAKLCCVRQHGRSYSARIPKLSAKEGTLRVQAQERKLKKFYYFAIPHSAFRDLVGGASIEIPFELDGSPRRIPGRKVHQNWWNYEVDSFDEMATAKPRLIKAPVSRKTRARDLNQKNG